MPSLYRFTCIFLCLFFVSLQSQAQITDDFSDGNFTSNPAWQGDVANFVVNASGELQLMAPGAGSSVLLVEGLIADSAVWELDIRLEFAPSTSNLLRIYLFADQSDLAAANGYYLEIGETGSMDALRLFRQDAGLGTLLLTGQLGGVASDPVDKRIRVKRSSAGGWTLEMRNPGGIFTPEGSVSDDIYAPGGAPVHFGFECLYTATRVDLFYFDNISIQADVPDLDPPQLLSASLDSPTQLLVSFDEILDQGSAELVGNYTVQGIGNPVLAELNANLQSVTLSFANPFPTGNYSLETNQVADALGNVSGVQSAGFSYVLVENAEEFDVLINEIMADPSPSAGLPEVEWLELYNRSDKIIDLSSLQLSDGGTAQSLPAVLLQPDSFFVLCSTSSASAFSGLLSNVAGMVGFPSLNNSGENLVLTRGAVQIDQVDFSLNWHTDPDKQDGGWTLERINPLTPCLGGDNWQSCPTIPGGTPGAANASLQEGPDTDAPYLADALPISATEVLLRFSEGLEQGSAVDPDSYVFDPVLTISSAEIYAGNRAEVLLTLLDPMASGQVYSLRSNANLLDCSGNASDDTQVLLLGLPEKPESQDLILNEVLFNPATGGTRFVEVYNQSDKIFMWSSFFIANFSFGNDIEPILEDRLILPGQYIVLTEDPLDILTRFEQTNEDWLLDTNLPSMGNNEGNITLYWSDGATSVTVDSFDYSDEYHNAIYTSSDKDGVSLERIRSGNPTQDPNNWTSAAGPPGGPSGTPTRPNSQALETVGNTGKILDIPVARLSPDGDGYEDFLNMHYSVPDPGYSASITIFDAAGIPVKHLVRQELLGVEGDLRWDGEADDQQRLRPGIYIVFAEFFHPDGRVHAEKVAISIMTKL